MEKVHNGEIKASKISGKDNPADLLTKHFNFEDMNRHVKTLGFDMRSERSDKSLKIGKLGRATNDYWNTDSQCLIRWHEQPRSKFSSPFQAAGAHSMSSFTSTRITHGRYVDSGETFMIQDNWTCHTSQRKDLKRSWTGRIVFIPKCDSSDTKQDGGNSGEETRSQMVVMKQQEIWRKFPIGKDYYPET